MNIAPATPTHSTPLRPVALATVADCPPQRFLPETERPARENAAPEVSAVAVLGYN